MGLVLLLPIKSALRDIWSHKSRLFVILTIVAISVGVPIAFLSTADSLAVSIDHEIEEYRLAHLDIRFVSAKENISDTISEIVFNETGRQPEDIWARPVGYGRMLSPNGQWTEIQVVGLAKNQPPTINQIKIKEGTYLTKNDTALILTSFAEAVRIKIGDKINLTASNNRFMELEVVGFVDSIEFGSYQLLEQGAVFTSEANTRYLAGLGDDEVASVAMYLWKGISDQETDELAEKLLADLEQDKNSVDPLLIWETRQISARKILQQATDLVTEYMAISSLLVFIIAGFVIYVIMNRYVYEHRKLIGVYHSYGFSKIEILLNFLIRIVIMGISGIILGIIAAYVLLYQIESFVLSQWAVNTIIIQLDKNLIFIIPVSIFSILIIFSFLPAWSAASMTPYSALRGKIGAVNIKSLKFIDKIPSLLLKQVLRAFSRNRARSIFTLFAVTFSLMLTFSLLISADSTVITLNNTFDKKSHYDAQITFFTGQNNSLLKDYRQKQGVTAVEPVFTFYAQMTGHLERIIRLVGILGNSTLQKFDLTKGISLQQFENKSAPVAVIPYREANDLNLTLGDNFTVRWMFGGLEPKNLTFTVIGIDRAMDKPISVFVNLEYLRQEMMDYNPLIPTAYNKENYFNSIFLRVPENQVKDFQNEGNILVIRTKSDFYNYVKNLVQTELLIVYVVAFLGFLVTLIVIFNTFYLSILEREREVAILRAFGQGKINFFVQFFLEAVVLSFIGYLLSIYPSRYIVTFLTAPIRNAFFPIDQFVSTFVYFIVIVLIIVSSLIAIYPGFRNVFTTSLAQELREAE